MNEHVKKSEYLFYFCLQTSKRDNSMQDGEFKSRSITTEYVIVLKHTKTMRWPGIEPGSTAWKAAMLTIIPPTLHVLERKK